MSVRTLRTIALAGAAVFIAGGVLELAHKQADHFNSAADYGIEAALALGMLGTLAGLYALHLRQERDLGAGGVWSFRTAAAGQLTLAVVLLATIARGHDALGPLFGLGVLAYVVGTTVYSVMTARAGVLPRWVGIALGVGTIVGIALNPGGTIVIGAVWLALSSGPLGARLAVRPALG
jgi:hypothetical protein